MSPSKNQWKLLLKFWTESGPWEPPWGPASPLNRLRTFPNPPMAKKIHYTRVFAQTHEVARGIEKLQFSHYLAPDPAWTPAINAYRYNDHFEICVDLAGVNREAIDLKVLSHKVSIHGFRAMPRPDTEDSETKCCQTLALEIENGPFAREIHLPLPVDPEGVTARKDGGYLWISLPIKMS